MEIWVRVKSKLWLKYMPQCASLSIHSLMVHYPAVTSQCSAQVVIASGVGRPAFEIPRGQLQFLIESRFSVPQIAQLLGVSISTVHRRMSSYNLSICSTYSPMTDDQLDELVAAVQQQFPTGEIDKCTATWCLAVSEYLFLESVSHKAELIQRDACYDKCEI